MFWWANFCRATHHGCVVLLFFVGLLEVVEDRFEWQFWPLSSECDNLAAVVIWGLAIVVMPVKTTFILEYRESRIFVQQTDRPKSIHDFTFSRASRAVHSYTIGAKWEVTQHCRNYFKLYLQYLLQPFAAEPWVASVVYMLRAMWVTFIHGPFALRFPLMMPSVIPYCRNEIHIPRSCSS